MTPNWTHCCNNKKRIFCSVLTAPVCLFKGLSQTGKSGDSADDGGPSQDASRGRRKRYESDSVCFKRINKAWFKHFYRYCNTKKCEVKKKTKNFVTFTSSIVSLIY